jgi:hypothetical protein
MTRTDYRGRRAVRIANSDLEVIVLIEGGHIAAITDRRSGINPLWTPTWKSIEPSAFGSTHHAVYGSGADGKLLAGIMGHNLCLDIFGGPSAEEAAAGLTAHGEGSVAGYDVEGINEGLIARAEFPMARLAFERRLELHGRTLRIVETVRNLTECDRPIGWTQHVTLGPPFLRTGSTEFRATATHSKVIESTFGPADYLVAGATFEWPLAPRINGGTSDLRRFTDASSSDAYTAHLMDPGRDDAFFVAFSAEARLAFGYVWRRVDFPWLGIWEENCSRTASPWNGREITRGMEFGVSPFPESRRQMIDRGSLFDVPTYRWIPARSDVRVEYCAVLHASDSIPETLSPE